MLEFATLRDVRNGRVDSIRSVMHAAGIPTTGQRSASQSLQAIVNRLITLDPRFRQEFQLEQRHTRRIINNVSRRRQITRTLALTFSFQEIPLAQ